MDTNLGMTRARALSGHYFPGQARQFSGSPVTPSLDKLYAVPFTALLMADALALSVGTAGSSDAVARLGLYASDPVTGLPGELIEDTGEFAVNAPGVFDRLLTDAQMLDYPYWIVGLFGGTTAPQIGSHILTTEELHQAFGSPIANGTPNVIAENAVVVDFPYGSLPANFPAAALGNCKLGLAVRSA